MNLIPVMHKAPANMTEQRLALCRACEQHAVMSVVKTEYCKKCGCPLLSKTTFLKTSCPLGKW